MENTYCATDRLSCFHWEQQYGSRGQLLRSSKSKRTDLVKHLVCLASSGKHVCVLSGVSVQSLRYWIEKADLESWKLLCSTHKHRNSPWHWYNSQTNMNLKPTKTKLKIVTSRPYSCWGYFALSVFLMMVDAVINNIFIKTDLFWSDTWGHCGCLLWDSTDLTV